MVKESFSYDKTFYFKMPRDTYVGRLILNRQTIIEGYVDR